MLPDMHNAKRSHGENFVRYKIQKTLALRKAPSAAGDMLRSERFPIGSQLLCSRTWRSQSMMIRMTHVKAGAKNVLPKIV